MNNKQYNKFGIIHFVGIGGIGMSGIAELMNDLGYIVQGSDISSNANVKRLKIKGIKIYIGHKKSNVKNINTLVFSSAINNKNIEIIDSIKRRIPVVSRAEMLGELMRFKRCITVSGSHGKTTTTSILGNILEEAKYDPTIVNGGIINSLSSNTKMGKGKWMIAEADESDGSFLKLPKEINIITNIDYEHMEYYKNFTKLYKSFKEFALNTPLGGCSVICLDNKNTRMLSNEISTREVLTYGIKKIKSDFNIVSIKYNRGKSVFFLSISKRFNNSKKKQIRFSLNMLGQHNVLNATAAIAVSLKIGIKIPVIQKALETYGGVQRRFTQIYNYNGVKIFDDYAHHPREIEATLEIAKKISKGKILVIFQPHRFSRTEFLYTDFINVLKKIDILFLTDIYAAGEKKITGLDKKFYEDLKEKSKKIVIKVSKEKELFEIMNSYLKKNNLIIFMGAGTITNWAKNFILKIR